MSFFAVILTRRATTTPLPLSGSWNTWSHTNRKGILAVDVGDNDDASADVTHFNRTVSCVVSKTDASLFLRKPFAYPFRRRVIVVSAIDLQQALGADRLQVRFRGADVVGGA